MAATSSLGSWQWLRFSLRELLGLTAFTLIGLMSLMHATAWVPNFWFTALLLSVAVALACWRAGRSAGFAEGYALFAGGYALLLLLSAWPQANQFMANPNAIHSMLITHSLNDWAYDRLLPLVREAPPVSSPGGGGFFGPGPIAQFGDIGEGNSGGGAARAGQVAIPGLPPSLDMIVGSQPTILEYPDQASFQRVAHCLWAIVIGYAGGRLMRALRDNAPISTVERTSVRS
jgi:hypothetical protein